MILHLLGLALLTWVSTAAELENEASDCRQTVNVMSSSEIQCLPQNSTLMIGYPEPSMLSTQGLPSLMGGTVLGGRFSDYLFLSGSDHPGGTNSKAYLVRKKDGKLREIRSDLNPGAFTAAYSQEKVFMKTDGGSTHGTCCASSRIIYSLDLTTEHALSLRSIPRVPGDWMGPGIFIDNCVLWIGTYHHKSRGVSRLLRRNICNMSDMDLDLPTEANNGYIGFSEDEARNLYLFPHSYVPEPPRLLQVNKDTGEMRVFSNLPGHLPSLRVLHQFYPGPCVGGKVWLIETQPEVNGLVAFEVASGTMVLLNSWPTGFWKPNYCCAFYYTFTDHRFLYLHARAASSNLKIDPYTHAMAVWGIWPAFFTPQPDAFWAALFDPFERAVWMFPRREQKIVRWSMTSDAPKPNLRISSEQTAILHKVDTCGIGEATAFTVGVKNDSHTSVFLTTRGVSTSNRKEVTELQLTDGKCWNHPLSMEKTPAIFANNGRGKLVLLAEQNLVLSAPDLGGGLPVQSEPFINPEIRHEPLLADITGAIVTSTVGSDVMGSFENGGTFLYVASANTGMHRFALDQAGESKQWDAPKEFQGSKHTWGMCRSDGELWHSPYRADGILKFNTESNIFRSYPFPKHPGFRPGVTSFYDAVYDGQSRVCFAPSDANGVLCVTSLSVGHEHDAYVFDSWPAGTDSSLRDKSRKVLFDGESLIIIPHSLPSLLFLNLETGAFRAIAILDHSKVADSSFFFVDAAFVPNSGDILLLKADGLYRVTARTLTSTVSKSQTQDIAALSAEVTTSAVTITDAPTTGSPSGGTVLETVPSQTSLSRENTSAPNTNTTRIDVTTQTPATNTPETVPPSTHWSTSATTVVQVTDLTTGNPVPQTEKAVQTASYIIVVEYQLSIVIPAEEYKPKGVLHTWTVDLSNSLSSTQAISSDQIRVHGLPVPDTDRVEQNRRQQDAPTSRGTPLRFQISLIRVPLSQHEVNLLVFHLETDADLRTKLGGGPLQVLSQKRFDGAPFDQSQKDSGDADGSDGSDSVTVVVVGVIIALVIVAVVVIAVACIRRHRRVYHPMAHPGEPTHEGESSQPVYPIVQVGQVNFYVQAAQPAQPEYQKAPQGFPPQSPAHPPQQQPIPEPPPAYRSNETPQPVHPLPAQPAQPHQQPLGYPQSFMLNDPVYPPPGQQQQQQPSSNGSADLQRSFPQPRSDLSTQS